MKHNHADTFFNSEKVIDIQNYVKNVHESEIISIQDNVREYLKNNDKLNTLAEIQKHNKWKKPEGVIPDRTYSFDDILKRAKQNPNTPFSVSTVVTSRVFCVWSHCEDIVIVIHNL